MLRAVCCAVGYGEAQQAKRMLLLDDSFRLLRSLPLACGRAHHSLLWRGGALLRTDTPPAVATGALTQPLPPP